MNFALQKIDTIRSDYRGRTKQFRLVGGADRTGLKFQTPANGGT